MSKILWHNVTDRPVVFKGTDLADIETASAEYDIFVPDLSKEEYDTLVRKEIMNEFDRLVNDPIII